MNSSQQAMPQTPRCPAALSIRLRRALLRKSRKPLLTNASSRTNGSATGPASQTITSSAPTASLTPRLHTNQKLTVIVNTFERLELLKLFVAHYSHCAAVVRIHVNWAESDEPPTLSSDISDKYFLRGGALTFALPGHTHNDTSLNTRFLPVPGAPQIFAL